MDTTAPIVTITSPTITTYNTNSVILTYSVSDGSITIFVDDNIRALSSGDTISGLSDGDHNITIVSVDGVGNIGTSTLLFSVDTIAPIVTITSPTASTYGSNSVTLLYDVSDGSVTVYVDEVIQSLSSGDTVAGLSDGNHNVTITSEDAVGNIGTATILFSVDTTAPTI
ncbi:MAG: hypothetical protein ACXAB7_15395, partial [Candidatus Kariarchaeaceae archaeon]